MLLTNFFDDFAKQLALRQRQFIKFLSPLN